MINRYEDAVTRGTLIDAIVEFKKRGGSFPSYSSFKEAIDDFIKSGGTKEKFIQIFDQAKAAHDADKALSVLIDQRKK